MLDLTISKAIYPFNAVSHLDSISYKPADFRMYLHASKLKGSSSTIKIVALFLSYRYIKVAGTKPIEFSESTIELFIDSSLL